MPNRLGNNKEARERREAQETEYGKRYFIELELELLSLKIKQLAERYDHPPEILESMSEGVERLRKMNKE